MQSEIPRCNRHLSTVQDWQQIYYPVSVFLASTCQPQFFYFIFFFFVETHALLSVYVCCVGTCACSSCLCVFVRVGVERFTQQCLTYVDQVLSCPSLPWYQDKTKARYICSTLHAPALPFTSMMQHAGLEMETGAVACYALWGCMRVHVRLACYSMF